jgi:hypothetical protein
LLDINQNDIKIHGKIVKFQKYFLFFILIKKNWAGPGPPSWAELDPAHILWAGLSPAA